jgi:hypothetical protein
MYMMDHKRRHGNEAMRYVVLFLPMDENPRDHKLKLED